jgi:hypothetical protein
LHAVSVSSHSVQSPRVSSKSTNAHQRVAISPSKAVFRKRLSVVERDKWRSGKIAVRELLQSQEHAICLIALVSAMRESTNQVIEGVRRDFGGHDKMTNGQQIERLLHDCC